MSPEAGPLAAWGAALVAAVMLAAWFAQRRSGDAGAVDVAWSANLALLALLYAAAGPGLPLRRALVALMGGVSGARLAAHIWARGRGRPEDGRYAELRRKWGRNIQAKLLAFFLLQGLLDLVLAVPFLLAAVDPRAPVSRLEWAGVGLWAIAIAGESAADRQLERFKANPANRGRTCRDGLWRYSRHPNYFFEWLVWIAWALFALPSPGGWLALACPALMLFFLLRVTGIPATEEQALRSREDYREYQRTTPAFVPWFPKA